MTPVPVWFTLAARVGRSAHGARSSGPARVRARVHLGATRTRPRKLTGPDGHARLANQRRILDARRLATDPGPEAPSATQGVPDLSRSCKLSAGGGGTGACPFTYTVQAVEAVDGVPVDWSRLTVDVVGDALNPAEIDTVSIAIGQSTCGHASASEVGVALCTGGRTCPSDTQMYFPVGERGVVLDASSLSGSPAIVSLYSGLQGELRAIALVDFGGGSPGATVAFDDTTSTYSGSREEFEDFVAEGVSE